MKDNWSRNIHIFFDKPDRFRALWHIRDQMSKDELCKLFGEVWIQSESHYKNLHIIYDFLDYFYADYEYIRKHTMTDDEKQLLNQLCKSKTIRVYRGCNSKNIEGYSWTLNKKKAEWFAKRYTPDGQSLLVSALAKTSDIIMYLAGRDEQEVVINPNDLIEFSFKQLPKQKQTSSSAIFQAIQAGTLFDREQEKQKFIFIASLNKEQALREVNTRIGFYDKYKFKDELTFWSEIKEAIS